LPEDDKKKVNEVWKAFQGMEDSSRRVVLDGLFGLCSWPQLTFSSAILKPLVRIDFVSELPTELGWKIMSHLDAFSLCQASLVTSFFHFHFHFFSFFSTLANLISSGAE